MTNWFQCVIAPLLFVVVLAAFAGLMTRQAAANEPPKPRVIAVFSADYCTPCHDLIRWMGKHGIKTKTHTTREQPAVEEFPTVFYDLGGRLVKDNGQNIYRGNYRLPETPVTIVEWITKG